MNNTLLQQLAAKARNLFLPGTLQKRYGDSDGGAVQVKTHSGRVIEKKESFPYGFTSKAKSGRVLVFCQGGNFDTYEVLPTLKADDISAPELQDGDAALYTGEGAQIIVREAGGVEVYAKGSGGVKIIAEDGTLYFANGKNNMAKILIGLIDEIKALVTTGAPPTHTINEASKQKLEAYKNKIKELYAEAE